MTIEKLVPTARNKRDQRIEEATAIAVNALIDVRGGGGTTGANSHIYINELADLPTPTNIGLTGIFTLQPNDNISLWVANTDSSSNVIIKQAKFTILRVL